MLTLSPYPATITPMTNNTDTIKLKYFPKTSEGEELNCKEARTYTLTELGNPIWTKNQERIRGIWARVEERDNEWRRFLFARMARSSEEKKVKAAIR